MIHLMVSWYYKFHKQRRRRGFGPSKGALSALSLQGSETKTRGWTMRGHWFALQENQWFFYKKETENNCWVSGQTWNTYPIADSGRFKLTQIWHSLTRSRGRGYRYPCCWRISVVEIFSLNKLRSVQSCLLDGDEPRIARILTKFLPKVKWHSLWQ